MVWHGEVVIQSTTRLAEGYCRLDLAAPQFAAARPGQFLNVLTAGPGQLLRRPISFFSVSGMSASLVVGIQGAGTAWLAEQPAGARLDVTGPHGGRGLSIPDGARRVALVGGGVGVPPLHFAATRARGVDLTAFVGARTASRLLCLEALAAAGCRVIAATDDGTKGYCGTAVAALASEMASGCFDAVLCCGPTPMMRAVAALATERGVPCQVCLEARMACAVGACLSCVIETTAPGWRRYQRVCTEGPVFDAAEVVWETLSPLCAVQ